MRSVTQWKLFALGLALAGIYAVVEPQIKSKAVVVEMTDEAEPEAVAAAEVPQPLPAPPAKEVAAVPMQTARIPLNAHTLDESMKLTLQYLSYAQQGDVPEMESQPVQFRQAALTPVTVTKKEEPKKVAVPAPKKKKEWEEMSGFERRAFVISYIKTNHLVCPPSGKDPDGEAKELADHGWMAVRGGIWWFCSSKKSG